jgi:hypothetical protein
MPVLDPLGEDQRLLAECVGLGIVALRVGHGGPGPQRAHRAERVAELREHGVRFLQWGAPPSSLRTSRAQ